MVSGRAARRVQLREDRKDGWTEEKKDLFIETLRATCNISASLRAVGMSRGGLDRLRARDGAFRAAMEEARRQAYVDLEFFTLEKMMNGTVKTVTKPEGKVETVHEYPVHLALQLLRLHRDVAGSGETAAEAQAEPDEALRMEAVERVMRKLGKLRARMDRERAAAAAGKVSGNGAASDSAEEGHGR
jgi:hypothetical protein